MDRLSEAVQVCRLMFDSGVSSFSRSHYSVIGAFNFPRPVQERIPILVGGGGERRTLRLVVQYADVWNLSGSLATLRHKLDVLERHADEVGRDPNEITATAIKLILVDDTPADAQLAAEVARANIGMDKDAFADFAVFGDPNQVREQAESLLAMVMDGIVCTVPNPFATESVVAAGETFSGGCRISLAMTQLLGRRWWR